MQKIAFEDSLNRPRKYRKGENDKKIKIYEDPVEKKLMEIKNPLTKKLFNLNKRLSNIHLLKKETEIKDFDEKIESKEKEISMLKSKKEALKGNYTMLLRKRKRFEQLFVDKGEIKNMSYNSEFINEVDDCYDDKEEKKEKFESPIDYVKDLQAEYDKLYEFTLTTIRAEDPDPKENEENFSNMFRHHLPKKFKFCKDCGEIIHESEEAFVSSENLKDIHKNCPTEAAKRKLSHEIESPNRKDLKESDKEFANRQKN